MYGGRPRVDSVEGTWGRPSPAKVKQISYLHVQQIQVYVVKHTTRDNGSACEQYNDVVYVR